MKTSEKSKMNGHLEILLLGISAIFAGFVNGFLGTGGGIVLMFALSMIPSVKNMDARDRFATLIAVILPLSAISLLSYRNTLDMSSTVPYLLPGILGGVVGALLLDRLSVKLVKKIFAVMVIWAGYNFLR